MNSLQRGALPVTQKMIATMKQKMGLPPARYMAKGNVPNPQKCRWLSRFFAGRVYNTEKIGTVFHELCVSPVNDEILLKQGQTRLASFACVSPCFNKITEQFPPLRKFVRLGTNHVSGINASPNPFLIGCGNSPIFSSSLYPTSCFLGLTSR